MRVGKRSRAKESSDRNETVDKPSTYARVLLNSIEASQHDLLNGKQVQLRSSGS